MSSKSARTAGSAEPLPEDQIAEGKLRDRRRSKRGKVEPPKSKIIVETDLQGRFRSRSDPEEPVRNGDRTTEKKMLHLGRASGTASIERKLRDHLVCFASREARSGSRERRGRRPWSSEAAGPVTFELRLHGAERSISPAAFGSRTGWMTDHRTAACRAAPAVAIGSVCFGRMDVKLHLQKSVEGRLRRWPRRTRADQGARRVATGACSRTPRRAAGGGRRKESAPLTRMHDSINGLLEGC